MCDPLVMDLLNGVPTQTRLESLRHHPLNPSHAPSAQSTIQFLGYGGPNVPFWHLELDLVGEGGYPLILDPLNSVLTQIHLKTLRHDPFNPLHVLHAQGHHFQIGYRAGHVILYYIYCMYWGLIPQWGICPSGACARSIALTPWP